MRYDVVVIGAGGAGLFCAVQAAKRGRRVVVLDHASKVGGKILISGGGRCNFTNIGASPAQYVSQNAHFCKSAMSRYQPQDFIALVEKYEIPYHEKKLGQLFCDRSAQDIVQLLEREAAQAGVEVLLETKIHAVENGFLLSSSRGDFSCESLVVATGGLSIPKLGATDFGYRLARQFGLRVTELAPALDGFTWNAQDLALWEELAGVSSDVVLSVGEKSFRENILFTHRGLSGPAALQGSLHWHSGMEILIDFAPEENLGRWLVEQKASRAVLKNVLAEKLARRLVERFVGLIDAPWERSMGEISDRALTDLGAKLSHWRWQPSGTVGYSKAEVTRGGVDTIELSSKTMECLKVPGLFFVGEVVDVTGWLGGYNFQWAWASGWVAGQNV